MRENSEFVLLQLAALLVIPLCACGPAGPSNGSVKGVPLVAVDSLWTPQSGVCAVLITDKPNICAELSAGRQPKNSTLLWLTFSSATVGEHAVGNGATAFFVRTEASCAGALRASRLARTASPARPAHPPPVPAARADCRAA